MECVILDQLWSVAIEAGGDPVKLDERRKKDSKVDVFLFNYQLQMLLFFFVRDDVFEGACIEVVAVYDGFVPVRLGTVFILGFENQYGVIFHQEVIFNFHIGKLDDLSCFRIDVVQVEIALVVVVQVAVVVAIDLGSQKCQIAFLPVADVVQIPSCKAFVYNAPVNFVGPVFINEVHELFGVKMLERCRIWLFYRAGVFCSFLVSDCCG